MKTILAVGGRGGNFANYIESLKNDYVVYRIKKIDELHDILNDINGKKVNIVAGLGGGSSGQTVVQTAATLSQNNIDFTIFASLPFKFEGGKRDKSAKATLETLHKNQYKVIAQENDEFLKQGASVDTQEIFSSADKIFFEKLE
jgi:cell division GTPase FtsZ